LSRTTLKGFRNEALNHCRLARRGSDACRVRGTLEHRAFEYVRCAVATCDEHGSLPCRALDADGPEHASAVVAVRVRHEPVRAVPQRDLQQCWKRYSGVAEGRSGESIKPFCGEGKVVTPRQTALMRRSKL
jgi:hypothetical protein